MVERLFRVMPWGCLRMVIVVFPDHTHLLFLHSGRYALYAIFFRILTETLRNNIIWNPDQNTIHHLSSLGKPCDPNQ